MQVSECDTVALLAWCRPNQNKFAQGVLLWCRPVSHKPPCVLLHSITPQAAHEADRTGGIFQGQ